MVFLTDLLPPTLKTSSRGLAWSQPGDLMQFNSDRQSTMNTFFFFFPEVKTTSVTF